MVFMWLLFEVRDISKYFISHQKCQTFKLRFQFKHPENSETFLWCANFWWEAIEGIILSNVRVFNCFVTIIALIIFTVKSSMSAFEDNFLLFGLRNVLASLTSCWVIWMKLIIFRLVFASSCPIAQLDLLNLFFLWKQKASELILWAVTCSLAWWFSFFLRRTVLTEFCLILRFTKSKKVQKLIIRKS